MESNDKKLEAFIDKLMVNDTLEEPSADFTNAIIEKLNVKSKSIVYKPLVSKWGWIIVSILIVALAAYIILNYQGSDSKISELLNLSQIEFNPIENMSFELSNTLMYAVVLFAIMLSIQIPILKQYFNKRMQF